MRRAIVLLFLCGSCRSREELPPEMVKTAEVVVDSPGAYSGFVANREGCTKLVGYFEPVVTLEELYIQYKWRLLGSPEYYNRPPLLYVDDTGSGYDLGNWRHRIITAVGRIHRDVVIGQEREIVLEPKRILKGDVFELISIDTLVESRESLEGRIEAKETPLTPPPKPPPEKLRPLDRPKLEPAKAPAPKPPPDKN